jgi:hypothetical protein
MNSVRERSACSRKATEWLSLIAMGVGKIGPVWTNIKVSTAKVKLVWARSGEVIQKKNPPFKNHYGTEARTA